MTIKMLSAALLSAATLGAAGTAQAETFVDHHVFGTINGVSISYGDTVLYSDGSAFNLNSAELYQRDPWHSPDYPGADGTVTAYRNGQEVATFSNYFTFGQAQSVTFNWTNIDTVVFQSQYSSDGTFLTADKLVGAGITQAVPEPESYAMLMAGLGVVGFVARRRKAA